MKGNTIQVAIASPVLAAPDKPEAVRGGTKWRRSQNVSLRIVSKSRNRSRGPLIPARASQIKCSTNQEPSEKRLTAKIFFEDRAHVVEDETMPIFR